MKSIDKNEMMLFPSKAKNLFLMALCIVFVIIGLVAVKSGENSAWVVVGFFGPCLLLLFYRLVPGTFYLKLTREYFEVKTLFRIEKFAWSDVDTFGSGSVGRDTKVVFNFTDEYRKNEQDRTVSKFITGSEGFLPGTYGKSTEELAELMNKWKRGDY